MPQTSQTFKNHTRFFPPFHFFVAPVLLLNALNAIRHLYLAPSLSTLWSFVVAAALVMLALVSRIQTITVQDRLIRLEMRLRLQGLLPPDLQPRINDLTHRQLVALRFASDEELPVLCREVFAGNVTAEKDIKQRVKNWQGDHLRA